MTAIRIVGVILSSDDPMCLLLESTTPRDVEVAINRRSDCREIIIEVDSCGGSIPAAFQMAKIIAKHQETTGVKFVARIRRALSAATIPALQCDERIVYPDGTIMLGPMRQDFRHSDPY